MEASFSDDEKLYRAVFPDSMFWKDNGQVSSAAFLSKKGGCSVDRGDYRNDSDVVKDMRNRNFKGSIITVKVKDCRDVEAGVVYAPSKNNPYHSEIHRDKDNVKLTAGQRRHLAHAASVISG